MITLLSAFVLTLGTSAAPTAAAPVDFLLAPQDIASALCLQSAAPIETARKELDPDVGAQAYCEADCTEGPNVSCSGDSCSAQNQNCPGTQGHVQCDGQYQFCNECQGGGCTFQQCRQGCSCPGCFSSCVNLQTCECECICQ
jgi:hypothetical protein